MDFLLVVDIQHLSQHGNPHHSPSLTFGAVCDRLSPDDHVVLVVSDSDRGYAYPKGVAGSWY